MAARVTKGTKPVQDRFVIAKGLGKRRVRMQRVPVTAQAVQQCLVGVGFFLDHRIRFAGGRHIDLAGIATLTAPATGTFHERGHLVVGHLVTVLVGGSNGEGDDCVRVLVQRLLEFEGVFQLGMRRQWPLDLGVLLTMQ